MDGWWRSRCRVPGVRCRGTRSPSRVVRHPAPDTRHLPMDTLLHDLRYAMRILRRNPTFAVVAILALALGTGANAAIFQLVNALRLRSLPVENPHELLSIGIDLHGKGRVGRGYPCRSIFTEPLWREIPSDQHAL